MDYEAFTENDLVQDGVIRNLIVIGEATKLIPEPLKCEHAGISWRKIVGMRDILTHTYFGVHNEIVWDELHVQCNCLRSPIWGIVRNKIPELQVAVREMLDGEPAQ